MNLTRCSWSLFAAACLCVTAAGADAPLPAQALAFLKFAPQVQVQRDGDFLRVESNGLPAHQLMVGITAWQQQVPLAQSYFGANAWRIPLVPVPAREPASIRNRFLRGAIALAVNGIPIFNPQNNRGEISAEIGELDEWGGHCGRADDYHYHAAPLHLQAVLGKALPIAYALDGYAIYGLTEPDGSVPTGLDSINGHTTATLGYHYHASTKYPYVNGGFHGEVVERGEQVDPQPRAQSIRPALTPLRGAKITGYDSIGANSRKLTYEVNGETRAVVYAMNPDGSVRFEFQDGRNGTSTQIYRAGMSSQPPRPERNDRPAAESTRSIGMDALKKPAPSFVLTSLAVVDGGNLPPDYTGDGSGATLPLAWQGAPAGTQSFALVMDHLAPGDQVKSYWTMWDIPASTTALPKNVQGIGKLGTSFKGAVGYQPPHSQGPGPKTYVLTVYALSAAPAIAQAAGTVTREVLLSAMEGKVLASASLHVVYERGAR
jgi:phosphatidylethanolamine-binding protein (PEBP) family uncharacterized protein